MKHEAIHSVRHGSFVFAPFTRLVVIVINHKFRLRSATDFSRILVISSYTLAVVRIVRNVSAETGGGVGAHFISQYTRSCSYLAKDVGHWKVISMSNWYNKAFSHKNP